MIRLILLLFVGAHASAATLEQEYVQRLSRARKNEVEQLQIRFERIRMLRLACGLQIKEKQVPISCYEAVKEEARWDLRKAIATRTLISELDERCARSTGALNIPPQSADLNALSPACAHAVKEARRIQAYRSGGKSWSEN